MSYYSNRMMETQTQKINMDDNENIHGGSEIKVLDYTGLFNKAVLTKKIGINMDDLVRDNEQNIKAILEGKIKLHYEGLCIKEGYIKHDSVLVLSYSMGVMRNSTFEYTVIFECDVCQPYNGMKIKCDVKNITKAGLRCVVANLENPSSHRKTKTPLVVFIARDYYYDNDTFNSINENDTINVEVIGTRFELNDDYIVVFADLIEE